MLERRTARSGWKRKLGMLRMALPGKKPRIFPVDVSLPVTWTEDGKAVCYVTFELNNAEILLHHPVETWHSGKHILSLYYPIENIVPNITNTFNVYLRMEGGSGSVGIGDCIASISGQAMAAAAAWDGRIDIEESAALFSINSGLQARGFTEAVDVGTMELVQKSYADTMTGRTGSAHSADRSHSLKHGRIEIMVLKGVMTIELTDENTGAVETVTEENMITEAVNNILGLNPMGIFYAVTGGVR